MKYWPLQALFWPAFYNMWPIELGFRKFEIPPAIDPPPLPLQFSWINNFIKELKPGWQLDGS